MAQTAVVEEAGPETGFLEVSTAAAWAEDVEAGKVLATVGASREGH